MRRALDAAKAKLDSLTDRDAILDCFFEHSRALFQFSVLFVIRGDTAHGRNVDGLGAHDDLVARTMLSMRAGPGILQRARDQRRPFVTGSGVTEADTLLFGSLGRAMPAGLVVPLVLRDRVVGIFLGDGPVEPLQRRGAELGRSSVELAKDEMLVWAEAVGSALERLIMRKKGTGSVRPPGFGSVPPPGMGDGGIPRLPPPPALPSWNAPQDGAALGEEPGDEDDSDPEATPRQRLGVYLAAAGLAVAALVVGGLYYSSTRPETKADRIMTAGDKLAGWPHAVDPVSVIDAARSAAGGDGHSELAAIQAEIGPSGHVEFGEHPRNSETIYVSFVFVTPDNELAVRVDDRGVHAPVRRPRTVCGGRPCRGVMPAPTCSFAQIREVTVALGLAADERVLITYADKRENELTGDSGPGWFVDLGNRGRVRVDPATCKPFPRERFLPAPTPVTAIPGAPRSLDPAKLVPQARAQTGLEADAVLLEIDARGVNGTGTVDLTIGEGSIAYTFADPVNVPGKARRWREVLIDSSGMRIKTLNEGLPVPRRFAPEIKLPLCGFAHAFKTVGTVPAGALANIRYGGGLSGTAESGQFEISVPSTNERRTISDVECAAWEKLVHK